MILRNTGLPIVLAAALLGSACASSKSWVPQVSAPDVSSWFTRENAVAVVEVGNDSQCNAPDGETRLQLLASADAVMQWQSSRGVALISQAALTPARYVVVDLGQRSTAGHGLAVSRQGGLRDGVLLLKATTFAPRPDAMSAQVITSPCALVRLPAVEFKSLRLVDQTGKVRASTGVTP
ncbi:PrcB C-terminal [Hydrocarboniphaga daqingensis]|uniref:PrcB C-terminal n=1 Tax=Hydrocarboniphaga daqingensis TaxID=490188 RepID=A0A1M5R8M9_9GAMM|nr:protease complex subunit PrcB family protein [Hydrocarboniphaga daqingensis]SHH22685.1 PrcB C-terminal [Hydrocarboniphaga daqingensis]